MKNIYTVHAYHSVHGSKNIDNIKLQFMYIHVYNFTIYHGEGGLHHDFYNVYGFKV